MSQGLTFKVKGKTRGIVERTVDFFGPGKRVQRSFGMAGEKVVATEAGKVSGDGEFVLP